jgi:hypothetical protein
MISLPTWLEPVKPTLRTTGFDVSSWPMAGASSASPVTIDSTPVGSPARWASSAIASADSGVCSAGLRPIAHPTASAGAALRERRRKSTLVKRITGVHPPDTDEIRFAGHRLETFSPKQAADAGIAAVHQRMPLRPDLSVAGNVHLGQLPTRAGFLDRRAANRRTRELLLRFKLDVDPEAPVKEIARAVSLWRPLDAAGDELAAGGLHFLRGALAAAAQR